MNRIKLSKENLIEIVNGINDKTKMEFYYQSALEDKIEANRHIELVVFLVTLVRYFYDKLFVSKGINQYVFFKLNSTNSTEYKKIIENGEKEIESNLFFSKNMEKRFFDEKDINKFFKDFKIVSLERRKYG